MLNKRTQKKIVVVVGKKGKGKNKGRGGYGNRDRDNRRHNSRDRRHNSRDRRHNSRDRRHNSRDRRHNNRDRNNRSRRNQGQRHNDRRQDRREHDSQSRGKTLKAYIEKIYRRINRSYELIKDDCKKYSTNKTYKPLKEFADKMDSVKAEIKKVNKDRDLCRD